jgi:hypothetical protein
MLFKKLRPDLPDLESLKERLHRGDLDRQQKLLLCLSVGKQPKQIKDIKAVALDAGFRDASRLNISLYLGRAAGLAINTPGGWELTRSGANYVAKELPTPANSQNAVSAFTTSLEKHISQISDVEGRKFLEEALECIQHKIWRPAVVFTWVGAVSVLHRYVLQNCLSQFNSEAHRRDQKWKAAVDADGLGRLKEHDFLQILESISVIGKNVKQELESCLKLRNSCGHPTSLRIGEAKVAAHVETLIQNVFARFL